MEQSTTLAGATILLVDDNPANLGVLTQLLAAHSGRVLVAQRGETGIQIAQRAQPDLILLDVQLLGLDGFETCRRLKADAYTAAIPVLFVTVRSETTDKLEGFAAGAVDYITKPFQEQEVLARIRTQLRLRQLTQQLQEHNAQLQAAQEALGRANAELERRVAERTAELLSANQDLQAQIAERQRADAALTEERNLLRTLIDNMPDTIYVKDAQSRFLLGNLAVAAQMGAATPDELLGKTDFDFQPPELAAQYYADEQALLCSGQPLLNREELQLDQRTGQRGWLLTSKVPLRDSQGQMIGLVGISRDITAHKQAERRQAAQYAITRVLAESTTLAQATPQLLRVICESVDWEVGELWEVDPSQNLLRCVETWQMSSFAAPEFVTFARQHAFAAGQGLPGRVWQSGQPVWISNGAIEPNFARSSIAAQEGLYGAFGFPIILGGQTLGIMAFFSREIRQPDEELLTLMSAIGSQISQFIERKWAEEQLRESNERFRLLAESSLTGIYLIQEGRFRYVNPALAKVFGYTVEEVIDKLGPLDLAYPEDRLLVAENIRRRLEGEVEAIRYDFRGLHKDGSMLYVEVHGRRIEYGGTTGVIGTLVDITARKQAAEQLAASEAELRALFAAMTDVVLVVDRHGRYLKIAPTSQQLLYRPAQDLLGKRLHDVFPPAQADLFLAQIQAALAKNQATQLEYALPIDGKEIWFATTVSPMSEESVVCVARDITERKRAEEGLARERELLRTLVDNLPEEVYVKDRERRFLLVNELVVRALGAPSMDQVIGKRDEDFMPPDVAKQFADEEDELMRTGKPMIEDEHIPPHKPGPKRWYTRIKLPLREGAGKIIGLVGLGRDITERKQAEAERQVHLWFLESMDKVNRAIQGTNDLEQMMSDVLDTVLAIFACDRAWLIYPCDPQVATWSVPMEHTRPQYPGVLGLGQVPMDPELVKVFQTVRAASGPVQFGAGSEHRLPRAAARQFSIQSMLAMALYPKGDQPYLFGLHQCTSARVWTTEEQRLFQEIGRRLEDALTSLLMLRSLRESEARLEAAQRIAHVGYWDRDLVAGRVTLSDETCRIFGLPPQERIRDLAGWQQRWQELIHPEDRPRAAAAVAAALGGGPRYDLEYRVVRPSGEVRIVRSQGDVSWDDAGRPRRMFGVVQDISELRQAEEELRASEARFRMLVDQATDAFFLGDEHGRILDVNRQTCESLGYTREELIGMSPEAYDIHINVLPTFLEQIRARMVTGEVVAFDSAHRRKDGTVFPVEVRVRWFWQGGRRFGIALARDITERKRAEEELRKHREHLEELVKERTAELAIAKERAEEADRLKSAFLATMSHELRTPLNSIIGFTGILLQGLPGPLNDEQHKQLSMVKTSAHHLLNLINEVLDLSKIEAGQVELQLAPFDMRAVIDKTVLTLAPLAERKQLQLIAELAPEVDQVISDPRRVEQILLNLVHNAIKFTEQGQVRIECQIHDGQLLTSVVDSGIGIAPEDMPKLFTTFRQLDSTLARKHEGSGLGLAICKRLAELLGGQIGCESVWGQGSSFSFTLPLTRQGQADEQTDSDHRG